MHQQVARDQSYRSAFQLDRHVPVRVYGCDTGNRGHLLREAERNSMRRARLLGPGRPGGRSQDEVRDDGLLNPVLHRPAEALNHDAHTDHNRDANHQRRDGDRVASRRSGQLVGGKMAERRASRDLGREPPAGAEDTPQPTQQGGSQA